KHGHVYRNRTVQGVTSRKPNNQPPRLSILHTLKCFKLIICTSIGEAGVDAAPCEDIGICGEHYRGHRSPCRKPGHINPLGVDAVDRFHLVYHLLDRQCLALTPSVMVGIEPSETTRRIVDLGLLRQGKRETKFFSKLNPAGLLCE